MKINKIEQDRLKYKSKCTCVYEYFPMRNEKIKVFECDYCRKKIVKYQCNHIYIAKEKIIGTDNYVAECSICGFRP